VSGFERDEAASLRARRGVFALRLDGDRGVCTRLRGHGGPCAGYEQKISALVPWPRGLPRLITVADIGVVRAVHDATPTPAVGNLLGLLESEPQADDGEETR
jgi:hypothetical protein